MSDLRTALWVLLDASDRMDHAIAQKRVELRDQCVAQEELVDGLRLDPALRKLQRDKCEAQMELLLILLERGDEHASLVLAQWF